MVTRSSAISEPYCSVPEHRSDMQDIDTVQNMDGFP